MKCDICHNNEATIHVQEVVGGTKNMLNICSECAAEHNIGGDDLGEFNLAEILYNISTQMLQNQSNDPSPDDSDEVADDAPELSCACGWDTAQFRDGGRLGCPECYNVFAPILFNALHSMHKGTAHIGKHPGDSKNSAAPVSKPALTILSLQKELEKCVLSENYERAAKLRDKI
ncbi:MAG: UvrB/UvrC motif-containing protein, partial [Victivallales bacterium]|nr:UvrB/UvrC motif-containing protein [Victivallales bacterium]